MNRSKRDANGLNKRERAILRFIEEKLEINGYAPTVREICDAVHLSSTATVQGYLKSLEERGYVTKENQKGRTIRLLKNSKGEEVISGVNGVEQTQAFYSSKEMVNVPVIGRITAGAPILAVQNITDSFPIPLDMVGNNDCFMLVVRGESMINAGIFNGDYILVKRQNSADNGDIIVALVNGDEATVKTFYKEKDHIRLQPQNPTMDPIIVKNCQVLGKVCGVFRKM